MIESPELPWLWSGVGAYVAALLLVLLGRRKDHRREQVVLWIMTLGVALVGIAIGVRWRAIGHGPFLSMFEILLSNLFSLGLIFVIIGWRVPLARMAAPGVIGVLTLIGLWALKESPRATVLPPTYDNYWLWIHVSFGKLFLGTCLVSVGLAIACLLRGNRLGINPSTKLAQTDVLIWRFLSIAFVFHSFMLIAGAVWAQDAWGRYWDWDPLETWAFITWLATALLLHARLTLRIPSWVSWAGVVGVFVIAFFTFFGMPFISLAPHKGAV